MHIYNLTSPDAHVYGAFNLAYGIGSSVGPVVGGQVFIIPPSTKSHTDSHTDVRPPQQGMAGCLPPRARTLGHEPHPRILLHRGEAAREETVGPLEEEGAQDRPSSHGRASSHRDLNWWLVKADQIHGR